MVAAQWPGPPREIDPGPHPPEAPALSLDSAKARDVLGWAPRLSLENALEWTVSWHKAYEAGSDMRTVTEAEIETYERLVAGSGL
jgi:CDP-glucose 4,6-dehydratase